MISDVFPALVGTLMDLCRGVVPFLSLSGATSQITLCYTFITMISFNILLSTCTIESVISDTLIASFYQTVHVESVPSGGQFNYSTVEAVLSLCLEVVYWTAR